MHISVSLDEKLRVIRLLHGCQRNILSAECRSYDIHGGGQLSGRSLPDSKYAWDAGGRDVAAAKLRELGVSAKPLTLVDVARGVGFLGPDPDVIEVKPNRGQRAVPRV